MPGLVLALAATLAVSIAPAQADPIFAIYDVQVSHRFSYATEVWDDVDYRFPLRLTFDPSNAFPGSTYGPAVFSPIPLDLPSPPANLPLDTVSATGHQWTDFPGNAIQQYAGAINRTVTPFGSSSRFDYFRDLRLESYVTGLRVKPRIRPSTFPAHLGIPHNELNSFNANFQYAGYLLTFGDNPSTAPNSFAYEGYATLLQTNAVPEPGTILLTGAGVAALGQRRWLRHRRSRHRTARALLSRFPNFRRCA